MPCHPACPNSTWCGPHNQSLEVCDIVNAMKNKKEIGPIKEFKSISKELEIIEKNVKEIKDKKKNNERPRRHVFTLYATDQYPDFDPSSWKHDPNIPNLVGIAYQLEKGEQKGRLHIQGYIEYSQPKSSRTVARDLHYKGAWIKKAYGSREDNDYTNKPETYVPGGVRFSTWKK